MLAKNTQGEYLLGNPANMAEPRLWGLPVVVTNTMPSGHFLVLDAARTGHIADREDAVVRIAEQHADFFVRNMVVVLVEERLAIVIQLSAELQCRAQSERASDCFGRLSRWRRPRRRLSWSILQGCSWPSAGIFLV